MRVNLYSEELTQRIELVHKDRFHGFRFYLELPVTKEATHGGHHIVRGPFIHRDGDDDRKYLVKGIAGRKFARQFVLSDTVVVKDANLEDGILTISLENVIPEEQKPRKIAIK